jgi:hypothetical protein
VPSETLSYGGCPMALLVWLIWVAFLPGTARGEAGKRFALLEVEVAVPF